MKRESSSDFTQKLLFYGVGAGAVTLAAASVHGTIIANDPSFVPFTANQIYFSLQDPAAAPAVFPGTGTYDFELAANGPDFTYNSVPKAKVYTISANSGVVRGGQFGVARLAFGDTIGSASTFGVSTPGPFGSGTYQYLYNNGLGYWQVGTSGYLGLRIDVTDPTTMVTTTDYGWAALSLNNFKEDGTSLTLSGYAYDNTGAAITAGAVAVPEPGTAALLVAGAAGAAALHRRRCAARK